MYQVSDAFREAMRRPVQRFRLRGQVTVGLRQFPFTEDNIQRRSFTIANQCSGSDSVEIGTVYTAELNAVFLQMDLPRYSLKGARITPRLELLTDDGYEGVPLGIFYINEANHTTWGVEVTAYDGMSKLDKAISINASQGTLYDFLVLACGTCGLTLGMTAEEVAALPNGGEYLGLYQDNDIETWRDLVAWCAQTAGAFATINRDGELVLRTYTTEPVDTIDDYHRYAGAKFSDFTTRYTGLSCVSIAEQVTRYYNLVPDDGLTYNLGSNPLLQYGLEEALTAQRTAVLNALAVINYVPMEVSMIGSPAYDLGDVLVFSGGAADSDTLSCVTKFDWTYGGAYTVTGVGQNPALASARSKVDKNIAGLMTSITDDAIHYYDYINAEEYHIGDGETAIVIEFEYVTIKTTHIDFHAEIKYLLETTEIDDDEADEYTESDGVLTVTYRLNGEEISEYHPVETVLDGNHLLHLLLTWESSANIVGDFIVELGVEGGEVWIDRGSARGYIAGQGVVGSGNWDGKINVDDQFGLIDVSVTAGAYTDEAEVVPNLENEHPLNENMTMTDVGSMLLGAFTVSIAGWLLHRFSVAAASGMSFENITTDTSAGVWRRTDTSIPGMVTTPAVSVSQVARVASRASDTDVAYIVSFDAEASWWTYSDGDGWHEPDYTQSFYGMSEEVMEGISASSWAEKLSGSLVVRAILLGSATLTDIEIYTEEVIA